MREQRAPHSLALAGGRHVGVPDQVDVTDRLDAHDAEQRAVLLVAPEHDARGDLAIELVEIHVRLVPAIRRESRRGTPRRRH